MTFAACGMAVRACRVSRPRLGHAMTESDAAAAFDPEAILEALLATKGEVDALRAGADARVRSALDRVEALSDRHMRGVKELRGDADQVFPRNAAAPPTSLCADSHRPPHQLQPAFPAPQPPRHLDPTCATDRSSASSRTCKELSAAWERRP